MCASAQAPARRRALPPARGGLPAVRSWAHVASGNLLVQRGEIVTRFALTARAVLPTIRQFPDRLHEDPPDSDRLLDGGHRGLRETRRGPGASAHGRWE